MPLLINSYRFTAAPFTPASVSGLVAWYAADGTLWQDSARTTPATADTHPIGAWDDAMGSGNHMLQATSDMRPQLKTNMVNSKPAVRTDGSNDTLVRSAAATLAPCTIFMVASPIGSSFSCEICVGDFAGGGIDFYRKNADPGALQLDKKATSSLATSSSTVASSTWHVLAIDVTSTAYHFFKNGADAGNGSYSSTTFTGTGMTLGSPAGDIAEIVVYDSVLNSTNRGLVTAYLGTKYNITVV